MLLENAHIKIRAVEPDDAETMWIAETDSEQWIINGMAAPFSRQNLIDYALTYDADPFRAGQIRLIIEKKDNGSIIGIIDLYDISALHRHAFAGIYIMPAMRLKGYAEMALNLIEEYAYRLLNLRQIGAKIMTGNNASTRLFKKCGYVLRGEIPAWFHSGNEFKDLMLFSKILKP